MDNSLILILMQRVLFVVYEAPRAISIWFVAWGVRSWLHADLELSRTEKKIRWLVVGVGAASGLIPGAGFTYVRLVFGLVGVAFLAWPNLAHHLTERFGPARTTNAGKADIQSGCRPGGESGNSASASIHEDRDSIR